jgi:dipeptidyl aminopeptidase/acylaminoacyl peptidase
MFTETHVSFTTEDGWAIHGTLSMPEGLGPSERVPAAVLLHSPAHDRDAYLGLHLVGRNQEAKESLRSALGRTATLRIDIRGRGASSEPREYRRFTASDRARVAYDVSGAIDFLSRQQQIEAARIAVVAEGASAEAALVASLADERVCGVVLLSGRVSEATRDLVASRADLPLLCVASKEDKASVIDMAGVYSKSQGPASDLMLFRDVGVGNSMFIMWANRFPNERSLESIIAEWITSRFRTAPERREVTFQSEDGWTLYGGLRVPRNDGGQRSPGVILLHSYLTDRYVFDRLEQMLSGAGIAVLNFDFRGRGRSIARGTYFSLPQEERDRAYLDARAAADYLAGQNSIDPDRLAVVATSIGVKYGLKAAITDDRIKSFVMLGGMPDQADVESARFPILFISSQGLPQIAEAFRGFYRMTRNRGSHLLEYEGAAIGYQVFDIEETLQPLIVRWLKPQLTLS